MEENVIMVPGSGTKVIVRDVKQEIETAFLDYSMSVIVSRALPDVRDGLKPVHRRILYTMHERGNDPSHPYRKSADTVGAVLGAYHPHGDASVYDAMVRLAQDFSLRYPLVDGQGNFGSVDGDPPAAYRYTEARMSKIACEMLTDIDKDTIDWDPNFDETKKEPHMLPSRFPNLLVNGSQGIAVGMATNIPPHNLREVVSGMIALIDDPEIDLAGLMEHIKGPDFQMCIRDRNCAVLPLAFFQYLLAKKAADKKSAAFVCMCLRNLCLKNQTVRFLRPLARRRANTLRPFLEAMRFKKP